MAGQHLPWIPFLHRCPKTCSNDDPSSHFFYLNSSGATPTEVGGTNAPASAKPAEAHPPALIMLATNAAIRRITNTASEDTLSAFIRQLELAAFREGGKNIIKTMYIYANKWNNITYLL